MTKNVKENNKHINQNPSLKKKKDSCEFVLVLLILNSKMFVGRMADFVLYFLKRKGHHRHLKIAMFIVGLLRHIVTELVMCYVIPLKNNPYSNLFHYTLTVEFRVSFFRCISIYNLSSDILLKNKRKMYFELSFFFLIDARTVLKQQQ